MKAIGTYAMLALCGCITGQPNTASGTSHKPQYEARGEGWNLIIKEGSIDLREKVGDGVFEYYGALPPMEAIDGGVRYQGQLLREYVVAGFAEEDIRPYSLTILEKRCTDRNGRIWATSVSFDFQSEYRPTGCGGALPR